MQTAAFTHLLPDCLCSLCDLAVRPVPVCLLPVGLDHLSALCPAWCFSFGYIFLFGRSLVNYSRVQASLCYVDIYWNSWNSALKCLKKMTRSLLYSLFSCALTLSQMFPMIPENSTSLLKGNGAIHLRPGYQHLQTRQFNMNKTLKITSSVNICVGVTSDGWVICI